jgi:hypothetical protein
MKRPLSIFVLALACATSLTPAARAQSTSTDTPPPMPAQGTVTWETHEKTIIPTGSRVINLPDFDDNHDGIISRTEVGAHMFKMFDTDGNEIIDNKEYERKAVLTIVPVEKTTKITYDFDNDGKADEVKETGEDFLKATQLVRFDAKGDGLSAHDFMERDFLAADVNRDHAIDVKEWQGSYNELVDKKNKENARFNK